MGRSPLTRGRLGTSSVETGAARSIPAHAGETASARRCGQPWRVDPRSRGGDVGCTHMTGPGSGRSPLTRGRPHLARRTTAQQRSIPAHAGETGWCPACGFGFWVDPRSRGGDHSASSSAAAAGGRSPLTRGRLFTAQPHAHLVGSIPAHAGETRARSGRSPKTGVDPRSRGGD